MYNLLKKTVSSRKNICRFLALDLLAVDQIGIFGAQQQAAATAAATAGDSTDVLTIPSESPQKALEPPANLARSHSLGSLSGSVASPMAPATPTTGSQQEQDYPAFVPPVLERVGTPRLPPTGLAPQSMASPTSMSSASFAEPSAAAVSKAKNPLAFLAYISGLITGLPFEDDEPLQLCAHLSKVINTHGAALQTQMHQTIVALKKLHGEHVDENDEEEVSQLAQPIETGATQQQGGASSSPMMPTPPVSDKASLLQSLALQGESAMAITILIQLRQWLQKSYELAGLFETW